MYGARAYLAYLRYGVMRFFKIKSYGAMANFGPRKKLPVPHCHEYWTVPKAIYPRQILSPLEFGIVSILYLPKLS